MEYSDEELVKAVKDKQPTSAVEIAEYLDAHPELIHERLNEIEEKGRIQKKNL